MELFLATSTQEMAIFFAVSFFHDIYLMGIGYFSALIIFLKMCTWSGETNALPLRYGWKSMIFGVLMGSVTYLAGSITKSTMKYVMLMLGFTEHSTTSDDNHKTWTTTFTDGELVSINYEEFTKGAKIVTNFQYLLKLSEYWPGFYYFIKVTQTTAPYIFLLIVDLAVFGAFDLLITYYMIN